MELDQLGDNTFINEPVKQDGSTPSMPTDCGDLSVEPQTPLQISRPQPQNISQPQPHQISRPRPQTHKITGSQPNTLLKKLNPQYQTPLQISRQQPNIPQQLSAPHFGPPHRPSSKPQSASCNREKTVNQVPSLSSTWPGLMTCLTGNKVTKQGNTLNCAKKPIKMKIKTHFPNKENEVICEYCDKKFSVNTYDAIY